MFAWINRVLFALDAVPLYLFFWCAARNKKTWHLNNKLTGSSSMHNRTQLSQLWIKLSIKWESLRESGVIITCQPFFILRLHAPYGKLEVSQKTAPISARNDEEQLHRTTVTCMVMIHQSLSYFTLFLASGSWLDHCHLKREINAGVERVVRGDNRTGLKCDG